MPIGGPLVINHVILDGSSSIGLLVHCRQANKLSLVRRGLLVYTRQSLNSLRRPRVTILRVTSP